MKIRFLNSVTSDVGAFSYRQVVDLDPQLAMGFVSARHAEIVESEERATVARETEVSTKKKGR